MTVLRMIYEFDKISGQNKPKRTETPFRASFWHRIAVINTSAATEIWTHIKQ
jgi:hypothetical protein